MNKTLSEAIESVHQLPRSIYIIIDNKYSINTDFANASPLDYFVGHVIFPILYIVAITSLLCSTSTTGMPMLSMHIAIPVPIVPAPITAPFRSGSGFTVRWFTDGLTSH